MSTTTITTSANSFNNSIDKNLELFLPYYLAKIVKNLKGDIYSEYLLTLFFYRFVSENLTYYLNKKEQKDNLTFNYTQLPDETAWQCKETIRIEKGFFIPPSLLFENVLKGLKNNPYFVPDAIKRNRYVVTARIYTENIEINSKSDITNISYLIKRIFNHIYFYIYYDFYNQKFEKKLKKWDELFKPVYDEFLELGDTSPFLKCSEEQVPKLIKTIKRKNKEIIKIMDIIARIRIEDLIKKTGDYNFIKIFEIQYKFWRKIKLDKFL